MGRTYLTEKDVKAEVRKLLTAHKWKWWMPPMNGFGQTGISDFNALRGGVFLAVETKFKYNKPTPQQIRFLTDVLNESGFGFVVNEKRIDTFRQWLEAFDRSIEATAKGGKPSDEDGALMLDCIKAMTEELAVP